MMRVLHFLWFKPTWHMILVFLSVLMIIFHLLLKKMNLTSSSTLSMEDIPLLIVIIGGGLPLIIQILIKIGKGDLGADALAAIAIIAALFLDQYLAAALVTLMLGSGQALENFALGKASSVLKALVKRMPTHAHLKDGEHLRQVDLLTIKIGDLVVILPHQVCPVDGVVFEGHGNMDESYLTGEPYYVSKAPGTSVFSGAINGETLLIVKAEKKPIDSRYSKIVEVMTESQQKRPKLRRLADQLGALFIPISLTCAGLAWAISGESMRFLSVLVIATPCPLLIAIPITIMSAISMAARRGIIIKDPIALERLPICRTAVFDKTGTLTYGKPKLVQIFTRPDLSHDTVLQLIASVERYSKHPLSHAIIKAAKKAKIQMNEATNISERPGKGLTGIVDKKRIYITSRKGLLQKSPTSAKQLPPIASGLECILMINDQYAATFQFLDEPRKEGYSFISHLGPAHKFKRILLLSGDKESEVKHLGKMLGITDMLYSKSPEQKLKIVAKEVEKAPTLFVGDGINDAPALAQATVGVAFGNESDITAAAASVLIMDSNLIKVEELIHISYAMRKVALQSGIGGMILSLVGMGFAAAGYIAPVAGALIQESIDILAILNALRLAWGSKIPIDMKI